ncbi:MAG: GNAT family N-acetyltransferase, partial [Clostridia bacterium]|nr:GNAT family N-acetyltransferase [Clostridia bacterium]
GIAQMLLNVLVDRLKENGLIEMYLTVNKGNLRAIRAYERFGFIRTDSIITDIGNGFVMDDYVYTFRI